MVRVAPLHGFFSHPFLHGARRGLSGGRGVHWHVHGRVAGVPDRHVGVLHCRGVPRQIGAGAALWAGIPHAPSIAHGAGAHTGPLGIERPPFVISQSAVICQRIGHPAGSPVGGQLV